MPDLSQLRQLVVMQLPAMRVVLPVMAERLVISGTLSVVAPLTQVIVSVMETAAKMAAVTVET